MTETIKRNYLDKRGGILTLEFEQRLPSEYETSEEYATHVAEMNAQADSQAGALFVYMTDVEHSAAMATREKAQAVADKALANINKAKE